jgi:hypothetical protein
VHIRVVRFTDVDAERLKGLLERVEASEGPPEDIPTTGLQILLDENQGTAVVLQTFASEEDMRVGDEKFGAMDPGDTPGTRASVDMCEIKADRRAQ